MPDGISVASAGTALKRRAYDLARGTEAVPGIFADTVGVLITYGHPGAERADDIVFFGDWRVSQDPGPLSATNRARDEQLEFDVIYSAYRGGGWQAELEAADRADELQAMFELYVRQTNTELKTALDQDDGVAQYCFMVRAESVGFIVTNDAGVEIGRNVSITATYAAVVRIEGNTP